MGSAGFDVPVFDRAEEAEFFRVSAKFFVQLAYQGGFDSFSGFDVSAGQE